MAIIVKAYESADVQAAIKIWNEVVREGIAFPQEDELNAATGDEFFKAQSFTGLAVDDSGEILALYILHPNNVGRCAHISNASYAVRSDLRGKSKGEEMTYGYIRVSSDKQTVENQKFEINNSCERQRLKTDCRIPIS